MLVAQESTIWSPMFDADGLRLAEFMKEHVPPKAVVLHSNQHVQPSASLAGRPSLVAYFGWVSNHGYNANDRLGDRGCDQ